MSLFECNGKATEQGITGLSNVLLPRRDPTTVSIVTLGLHPIIRMPLMDADVGNLQTVAQLLEVTPAYLLCLSWVKYRNKRRFSTGSYVKTITALLEQGWITQSQRTALLHYDCMNPPYGQIPIKLVGEHDAKSANE